MSGDFPVALIFVLGAVAVPFLRGPLRTAYMLLLPIIAFAYLLALPYGEFGQVELLGQTLVLMRVDRLSLLFGYIFVLASLLNVIYAIHLKDTMQHVAGLVYAGSSIGAVFAGDLMTLFMFWELTAVSSVLLIWAQRTDTTFRTGLRLSLIHI